MSSPEIHQKRLDRIDLASTVTLVITLFLFVLALIEKGLTHEILLEAGVFLVSLKLVLAVHKISMANEVIEAKLDLLLKK